MPEKEDKSSSATLEAKEKAADEAAGKENGKKADEIDPAEKLTPEHPRFQEVYGKWKTTERKLEQLEQAVHEKETDINLLRQHNQQLAESISTVGKRVDKVTEKPIPNPVEDPEGYAKYFEDKLESDRKQDQLARITQRHYDQVNDQRDMHEDYESVVKPIMQEMETNPELKNKVWGSINPAREAYRYGKSKIEAVEKGKKDEELKSKAEREKAIEQGQVEGTTTPPSKNEKRKLTDVQKRTSRLLGVSEDKYLKQLEAMEARDKNG